MIYKDKPGSESFVQAKEDSAQIVSGANSITTTKDGGNFINGPLSISSGIGNIKVGGIFRFNSMLSTGIPSTMITPIPVLKLDIPIGNLGSMAKVAAVAATLV